MSALAPAATPSLAERALSLLERVDYRRADTESEREAIYRLRYNAYLKEGAISPSFSRRFSDEYDDKPNAWIFGVHIDGLLAGSIRLHVTTPESSDLPGLHVFSDVLQPEIDAGRTIVDPTRFVADAAATRLYPELPYITLRLGWLACEYFNTDIVLATVRAEHQAFYRRVFGQRPVCAPRTYPSLMKPISLMMLDYREARDRVNNRYPFFRSTYFERRMLFERPGQVPFRIPAAEPVMVPATAAEPIAIGA